MVKNFYSFKLRLFDSIHRIQRSDHQVSDIGLYKFLVKKNSYDANKLFFWEGGSGTKPYLLEQIIDSCFLTVEKEKSRFYFSQKTLKYEENF